MNLKDKARNPHLSTKPRATAWFMKNPGAKIHFDLAKALVLSHYRSDNHGFIDRADNPEYRFNSVNDSFVEIEARQKHARVRFTLKPKFVSPDLRTYCKKVANFKGDLYDVVDFKIGREEEALHDLKRFLLSSGNHLSNFSISPRRTKQEKLIDLDEEILIEEIVGKEGKRYAVTHLRIERDRSIVLQKKKSVLNSHGGRLRCEVCDFDFRSFYGSLGDGFCEVHHLLPLKEAVCEVETKLEDLAVVCSNCHRMLHKPGIDGVKELRAILQSKAT